MLWSFGQVRATMLHLDMRTSSIFNTHHIATRRTLSDLLKKLGETTLFFCQMKASTVNVFSKNTTQRDYVTPSPPVNEIKFLIRNGTTMVYPVYHKSTNVSRAVAFRPFLLDFVVTLGDHH